MFWEGYGKPCFPSLDADTSLADLLGHDSWFTVEILKLDVSFLNLPVFEWEETESYTQDNKKNIKVLNDSAERAVKLTVKLIDKAVRGSLPKRPPGCSKGKKKHLTLEKEGKLLTTLMSSQL